MLTNSNLPEYRVVGWYWTYVPKLYPPQRKRRNFIRMLLKRLTGRI